MAARARRMAVAAVVAALVAVTAWACFPRANSAKAYAFLERHKIVCRVVRVPFVLAGRGPEFDTAIKKARLNRMLAEIEVAVYASETSVK